MLPDFGLDEKFMTLALELAARGGRATRPNPMVGAVVVRDGEIVGRGYHRCPGSPHAEAEALDEAGDRARDATLYVTLEPCCHTDKRTPPCAQRIIASGIKRVVYASLDPNPKVCGRTGQMLKEAGIRVDSGLLSEAERELNQVYRKYMETGRPLVTLKLAMSLDGRIAAEPGRGHRLSGRESQERVHRMRLESEAVLVGAGTAIADDPELTVRLVDNPENRQPTRFVVDSALRTPLDRRIWDQSRAKTVLATTPRADPRKLEELARRQVEVWTLDADGHGRVDLKRLMDKMGASQYYTLLVEGGAEIACSLLRERLVDRISFFYTPRLIGGRGLAALNNFTADDLEKSELVAELVCSRCGQDILIEGRLKG